MSHNITIKMRIGMADLEMDMCKDLFKELGWVFMKGGDYKGWTQGREGTVKADIRLAVPAEQAGAYGEDLSPQEAAQYGLPANGKYKVIAVSRGKAEPVKGKDGKPQVDAQGKPVVTESISVVGDSSQVANVQKKIEAVVSAAKGLQKVQRQIGVLQKGGNQVNVNIFQMKQQVVSSIKTMKPVKVTNQF